MEPLNLGGTHYVDPVGNVEVYAVDLKNEDTGETLTLTTLADHAYNAMNNARVYMFREFGWRRVTSLGARTA